MALLPAARSTASQRTFVRLLAPFAPHIEAAQRSTQAAIVDQARRRIAGLPADDHVQPVVDVPDRLVNVVTGPS